MKAPIPGNESQRLAALREYFILDTAVEKAFDEICHLSAFLCAAPMSFISLVDQNRQWFKARVGVESTETPRDISFCAHTIMKDQPNIVPDATCDPRFADSPLVTGEPHIRFYAGFPLLNPEGFAVGALCAADRVPRTLSAEQRQGMEVLARQVIALMEVRRISRQLTETLQKVQSLQELLPICAWCKKIRDDQGYWNKLESYMSNHVGLDFTHSICPDCYAKVKPRDPAEDAT